MEVLKCKLVHAKEHLCSRGTPLPSELWRLYGTDYKCVILKLTIKATSSYRDLHLIVLTRILSRFYRGILEIHNIVNYLVCSTIQIGHWVVESSATWFSCQSYSSTQSLRGQQVRDRYMWVFQLRKIPCHVQGLMIILGNPDMKRLESMHMNCLSNVDADRQICYKLAGHLVEYIHSLRTC
jgi:hypothetical protein